MPKNTRHIRDMMASLMKLVADYKMVLSEVKRLIEQGLITEDQYSEAYQALSQRIGNSLFKMHGIRFLDTTITVSIQSMIDAYQRALDLMKSPAKPLAPSDGMAGVVGAMAAMGKTNMALGQISFINKFNDIFLDKVIFNNVQAYQIVFAGFVGKDARSMVTAKTIKLVSLWVSIKQKKLENKDYQVTKAWLEHLLSNLTDGVDDEVRASSVCRGIIDAAMKYYEIKSSTSETQKKWRGWIVLKEEGKRVSFELEPRFSRLGLTDLVRAINTELLPRFEKEKTSTFKLVRMAQSGVSIAQLALKEELSAISGVEINYFESESSLPSEKRNFRLKVMEKLNPKELEGVLYHAEKDFQELVQIDRVILALKYRKHRSSTKAADFWKNRRLSGARVEAIDKAIQALVHARGAAEVDRIVKELIIDNQKAQKAHGRWVDKKGGLSKLLENYTGNEDHIGYFKGEYDPEAKYEGLKTDDKSKLDPLEIEIDSVSKEMHKQGDAEALMIGHANFIQQPIIYLLLIAALESDPSYRLLDPPLMVEGERLCNGDSVVYQITQLANNQSLVIPVNEVGHHWTVMIIRRLANGELSSVFCDSFRSAPMGYAQNIARILGIAAERQQSYTYPYQVNNDCAFHVVRLVEYIIENCREERNFIRLNLRNSRIMEQYRLANDLESQRLSQALREHYKSRLAEVVGDMPEAEQSAFILN